MNEGRAGGKPANQGKMCKELLGKGSELLGKGGKLGKNQ